MPGLNPRQAQAVRHTRTPLLVLAGAGSGKTRVITEKIVHLIDAEGLSPRHVKAVTFTNKAAREMRERVSRLLKGRDAQGLSVSTFHALGLSILRLESRTLGLKPGFSILDAQDSESLLRELLGRDGGEAGFAARCHWKISEWKNGMLSPEAASEAACDGPDRRTARLYDAYQRALRAYNAVDFDDLIRLPVQLFRDQPEVLDGWQNRVRHLLVDEYQDTNLVQYELVRQLVGVREGLTAVGDDDQSIYAWRGARPENLARLREDFPRLEVIKLEQNYRSTGRILRAANRLIGNNPHLFEKRLWSELGPGDPIRVMACRNEEDEVQRVVSEILHHRHAARSPWGEYAILYRGNHQARPFETALRQNRIPYLLSGGTSFFSRGEIKDVMAYLRLLSNGEDDAAFLRIVNTPRREIGPGTLEKLGLYAAGRRVGLLAAIDEMGLEQHLAPRAVERLRRFSRWVATCARNAAREAPGDAVRSMLRDLDYEGWLYDRASSDAVAERRWENVQELVRWLEGLHSREMAGTSLAELVNYLSLQDLLERQEEENGEDQVRLMTLHAAKGLEFSHVFLVGIEENLLPHRSSIDEGSIEEERRLAYVGVTRARRSLIISYARKRKQFGEVVACRPSRFLDELPTEDLVWEERPAERSAEEKRQRGSAHLASMKALLENP